jgi:succinate dehydrogenase / fumarate reductase flavoprotein subunit
MRNMLLVSRCIALAALERTESRGGHTREDHPDMDARWRDVSLVCRLDDKGEVVLERETVPAIRPELLGLFERSELEKYLTGDELSRLSPLDQEAGR